MKILVCGLPGSGKTTLAAKLASHLEAVHFNADDVRANISRDLGFSVADRIEQARRMAWLAGLVTAAGHLCVCDFVCPTEATRFVFDADFTIFMDTIRESRFADTNKLFEIPRRYDVRVTQFLRAGEFGRFVGDLVEQIKLNKTGIYRVQPKETGASR